MIRRLLLLFILTLMCAQVATAGGRFPDKFNTMGVDMELLSYGGSLGGFYSFHPVPALSLDFESDWAIVESNETFTYYNIYNQPISINNRNLSLVKFVGGVSYFPFLDTMHPSLQFGVFAGLGPLVSLNTDDQEKLFVRWQHVDTDVTVNVRSGIHLRILTGEGSAYNFKIGYDYAHFGQIIDGRQSFSGVFFQAAWEIVHR